MPTGYALYKNRPSQPQDRQPQTGQPLNETFTTRQRQFGAAPNPANRTRFPQASNHALAGDRAPQMSGVDRAPQAGYQPLYPVAPQPQPPQPKTYEGYSPNINIAGTSLMNAFKAKHKRDMTEQEKQALAKYVGYNTGDLTQDQWNKANWSVEHYSGDINNPGVPEYNPAKPAAPAGAGPRQPNPDGWTGTPGYGVTPPGAYTPDTANAPGTYNPFQFAQWTGMEDGQTGDKMQGILDQLLNNPEVLDEQTINQMKTRSKESALSQNEQLSSQFGSDLASRGFDGGGMEAAGRTALGQDLISTLINQNRDIDIGAKETNRASTLNALGAADAFLNSRLARGSENFANTLQGQGAQASENQFGANYNLDRFMGLEGLAQKANDSEFRNAEFTYGQVKDDRDSRLQEFLADEGVRLDRDKFDELKTQFKTATGMDLLKFLESQRQFNQSFGENQRQHNNQIGLGTAGLQLQGQNNLQNFINSIYGGN